MARTMAQTAKSKNLNRPVAPTQALPGREPEMKQAWSGAVGFIMDAIALLERFLVFGTTDGNIYADAKKQTGSAENVIKELMTGKRYQDMADLIIKLVAENKLYRKDRALYVLALMAMVEGECRKQAYRALASVVSIPTDRYVFEAYLRDLGGESNTLWRRSVQQWINGYASDPQGFAYHAIKYQSRENVSLKNMILRSHGKWAESLQGPVKYVLFGTNSEIDAQLRYNRAYDTIMSWEEAKRLGEIKPLPIQAMVKHIEQYGLTWEFVPSAFLTNADIWRALLMKGRLPLVALLRNLNRLTALGVLKRNSDEADVVVKRLLDRNAWGRKPVHPFRMLLTWNAYKSGASKQLNWQPLPQIVEALEKAFYLSFDFLPQRPEKILYAADTSGSMQSVYLESIGMSAESVTAVLAMIVARQFPASTFVSFNNTTRPLDITASMTLEQVMQVAHATGGGSTNAGSVFEWAMNPRNTGRTFDAVFFATDAQMWAGTTHVQSAYKAYMTYAKHLVKMAMIQLDRADHTMIDPKDVNQANFEGFNADTPSMLAQFVAGTALVSASEDGDE